MQIFRQRAKKKELAKTQMGEITPSTYPASKNITNIYIFLPNFKGLEDFSQSLIYSVLEFLTTVLRPVKVRSSNELVANQLQIYHPGGGHFTFYSFSVSILVANYLNV